jgi:beta-glucanase (GH16 family)
MKLSYIIFLSLIFSINCKGQTWNLVWSDEFNDSTIDKTNWTFETGGNGWGNNELEYYTTRSQNVKTENGNLLIIARKESYSGKNYTSARMKTFGLRSFTYGKIEARIKVPVGQGIWPAFWMMGVNNSWPQCGEVDIMEHINLENKNYGTMHWDNNGHVSYGGNTSCDESKFHTYGIEWDANNIKWFLDGTQYFIASIANGVNSTSEFHLPFYFLLNMAVGGNWPGNPNNATNFPDTMFVDYVRVYQQVTGINENHDGNISSETYCLQNYPNPFNPVTTISFYLPLKAYTVIQVFDMLGREVSKVLDQELAAGSYQRKWDAGNLPGGVYFYRFQAGQYSDTKKLLLLK